MVARAFWSAIHLKNIQKKKPLILIVNKSVNLDIIWAPHSSFNIIKDTIIRSLHTVSLRFEIQPTLKLSSVSGTLTTLMKFFAQKFTSHLVP